MNRSESLPATDVALDANPTRTKLFQAAGVAFDRLLPMIIIASGLATAATTWWSRGSLWEDEIIAITHRLQPFPHFFIEILRNDIHPFLYFLLLKIWTLPNDSSDAWALASSLTAVIGSAALVGYVTWKCHGKQAASWAVACFCALPTFAWSAGNLRMYALLPGVAVVAWYLNRRFLQQGGWREGSALFLIGTVFVLLHAIAFFFAAVIALAALAQEAGGLSRRRLVNWSAIQCVLLIVALPLAGSAILRGTEPLSMPSLSSLLTYPAEIMVPWGQEGIGVALGGVAFLAYAVLGVRSRSTRVPTLAIPCGVLLLCIVISSMGKPMFKPPVFTACLVPFLAMGAGVGMAQGGWLMGRALALVVIACLAAFSWVWVASGSIQENYLPAASYVRSRAQPGDVVVVPNLSVYWGILRYAVSPRWGHPLEIMPMRSNADWTSLKDKLGPRLSDQFGLNPARDYVDHLGVRYIVGENSTGHISATGRIWIVQRRNYRATVRVAESARRGSVKWFGKELAVTLAVSDPSGVDRFPNPP